MDAVIDGLLGRLPCAESARQGETATPTKLDAYCIGRGSDPNCSMDLQERQHQRNPFTTSVSCSIRGWPWKTQTRFAERFRAYETDPAQASQRVH